jgi:hypothetical protein
VGLLIGSRLNFPHEVKLFRMMLPVKHNADRELDGFVMGAMPCFVDNVDARALIT